MIAFDTDILTEILLGAPEFVARAATIPPIVVTLSRYPDCTSSFGNNPGG